MSQEVICVIKDENRNIVTSIKEIGTESVYLSQKEAIELVKRNPKALYINFNGKKVWVVAAKSRNGNEYLRAEADKETENTLLDLPYCRFRK